MVNTVILIGFLGSDPELKHISQGQAIARLRIATSRGWKDKDGKRHDETEWHDIEVWGKQAEACNEHLAKGRQVYVQGRLKTDSWTDKESDQKRYRTKIVAEQVRFLGAKPTEAANDEPADE
jgi:single-strand DNA-binding protein